MKLIKLNYDWMLLDVAIPATFLDANATQQHKYAPDGKNLYVFALPSESPNYYKVFAYTYIDKMINIKDDVSYNEDTQLLSLHYESMLNRS